MDLSQPHSSLEQILKKSQTLSLLTTTLREILPASYQQECAVINYRAGILVLGFHSAALLTQIRLQSEQMLHQFQIAFPTFTFSSIEYKVTPFYEKPKPVLQPLQPIPDTAKKMLRHLMKSALSKKQKET